MAYVLEIPWRNETVESVAEYWTHEDGTRFASVVTKDGLFMNMEMAHIVICGRPDDQ